MPSASRPDAEFLVPSVTPVDRDLRRLAHRAFPPAVRPVGWSALDRIGHLQQEAFERRFGVRTEAFSSLGGPTGRVRVEDVLPAQWPTRPWWWRTTWAVVTYRVVPEGQGREDPPRLRRRLFRPRRAIARWSGPNGNRDRVTRRDG